MVDQCPYCSRLQKAFRGHNYCSNSAHDNIHSIKSNSFYLTSNQMHSGNHISRLSIRGVLNGYQYYKTGKNDRVVKKDNYLIVEEGQSWFSEIEAESPIEMIVVAFHPDFISQANHSLISSSEQLLDNPFTTTKESTGYFENTYPIDQRIRQLFMQLKTGILLKEDKLFFEQVHYNLWELVFQKHQDVLKQASLLPSKKASVQRELLERLGTAKDFMDAHVNKKLELSEISQAAALSPYHFLRLFKSLYNMTPYQYLTSERMKMAHYLLQSSSKTVREVCFDVGFENHSSFGRVFKNHFEKTPLDVKKSILFN